MKKPHYAWAVCVGAALLLFCSSGLSINAFTIYQPYILTLNGFSNTQSSLILTFRSLFSFASTLLARFYYRRFSLRTGMGICGALQVLGYVFFGIAGSRFFVYCLAASLLGISYGLGTMIPVTILINRWFREKRNTALGICSAATGVSLFGVPSLISGTVSRFGLSAAFLLEAGAIAVLVLISIRLIRSSPDETGLAPYGEESGKSAETHKKERLLTVRDWLLLAPMLLLTGGAMNAAYSHLTVLITGEGFSPDTAALAMLISGVALMTGKVVYGRLGDRIGNYKSNFLFGVLMTGGLLLFRAMRGDIRILMFAMIVYTFGIAGLSVGISAWPADLAPGAGYEKTVQLFQMGYAACTLLFTSLPGMMADRANGSYLPAFTLFALFAVLIFTFVQLAYRRARRG